MTLMQNCYSVTKLWPTKPWRKTAEFTVVLKLTQGGESIKKKVAKDIGHSQSALS